MSRVGALDLFAAAAGAAQRAASRHGARLDELGTATGVVGSALRRSGSGIVQTGIETVPRAGLPRIAGAATGATTGAATVTGLPRWSVTQGMRPLPRGGQPDIRRPDELAAAAGAHARRLGTAAPAADTLPFTVLGRPDRAETDRVLKLLADGELVDVGKIGDGINGRLRLVELRDATGASTGAVIKTRRMNAAGEVFAHRAARALGMDHLVPRAAMRADGTAAIEFVRGETALAAGIHRSRDIERLRRQHYRTGFPDMPAREVVTRARTDRQLVQAFDYLTHNTDRHLKNVMVDRDRGVLQLIDHGYVRASRESIGRAYRGEAFFDGSGVLRAGNELQVLLDRSTLDVLRRADRTAITAAARELLDPEHADGFARDLVRRLDQLVEHGSMRVDYRQPKPWAW